MTKYKSKFTGQQIDDGIEYGVRVTQQTLSSAQKQQARENIGAQENVTDMAKLGCGFGTCITDSGTALVVSLTNYELVKNGHVSVNFEHDVPAGATLNINGKGAKPIYYKGSAITANTIKADDTVMFAYDGTNYVVTSLGGESGGGGATQEFAVISLKTDNNTDSALTGATIVITDDNTSETILSTTWSGTDIVVGIDGSVEYTITVGNVTNYNVSNTQSYTAIAGLTRNISFLYDYELYVNLGLPSGLLWSKLNVGAMSEEEYGLWFSWGNTEGYNPDIDSYPFNNTAYQSTLGNTLQADLGLLFDAAYASDNKSRMPSSSEFEELYDYTDKEYTSINNINGVKFMKKSDHNVYIFLPAAGEWDNATNGQKGIRLDYWSKTFNNASTCYSMRIGSDLTKNVHTDNRVRGLSIRPVKRY